MTVATSAKDLEITALGNTLHNYMLDTSILGAAGSWPGLSAKLVQPFVRQHMKVADVEGKPRPVVVDADGQPRYSKMAERAGELMQPDELLLEMSEQADYRQLFPSQQAAQGGGATPPKTPAGVRRTDKTANMTPAEKITAGLPGNKK